MACRCCWSRGSGTGLESSPGAHQQQADEEDARKTDRGHDGNALSTEAQRGQHGRPDGGDGRRIDGRGLRQGGRRCDRQGRRRAEGHRNRTRRGRRREAGQRALPAERSPPRRTGRARRPSVRRRCSSRQALPGAAAGSGPRPAARFVRDRRERFGGAATGCAGTDCRSAGCGVGAASFDVRTIAAAATASGGGVGIGLPSRTAEVTAGRSAGEMPRFASHRSMSAAIRPAPRGRRSGSCWSAARAIPASSWDELSICGEPCRCWAISAAGVAAGNGGRPTSISYSSDPMPKTSVERSAAPSASCSGAMYRSVPMIVPGSVRLASPSSRARAMPKSTRRARPSDETMTFAGFTSR